MTEHLKRPTNLWEVEVEVRQQDAQGVFWIKNYIVRAEERDVRQWAIDDAHYEGFETRFTKRAWRLV